MKKMPFLFIFCINLISTCFAQDLITKKSGEDIQVKILEVNPTDIKFKKTSNPDGPIFTISKSDLLMIRYANGTKDIFDSPGTTLNTVDNNTNVPTQNKNRYQFDQILNHKLSLGIKAGCNLNSLRNTDSFSHNVSNFNSAPGFQFGIVGKVRINNLFGISVEPGLITKGAKRPNDDLIIKFGYINMPILLIISPLKRLNFEIGPELNYRIYKSNWDFTYSKFNLSTIIGLSYDITKKINFGTRFSYDLIKSSFEIPLKGIDGSNMGAVVYSLQNNYIEIFMRYYLFDN